MKYQVVMGLEVHVELATESKLFCACSAKFGAEANEHTCPACAGMPGMLPIANKRAIELGMIAATVTNSRINRVITFDKKNYFYPDLSTGYQVTQWFSPICVQGHIDITTSLGDKRITLKQIHIEEDAGKLVHDHRNDTSLVDYNRASVPLVEIVSNPDFNTAEEVIAYLTKLQKLLTFAGVSDCKMQEGSMRCDVNISVREVGAPKLGVRTEIKNMSSFKAIERAIAYESQRHIDAIETGCEKLIQETRGWNDAKGVTFGMRSKENAHDYRYFPNPDIMPVVITDEWLEKTIKSIPESAESKLKKYVEVFGLTTVESEILTANKHISEIFDKTNKFVENAKEVANWVIADLLSCVKAENTTIEDIKIDCEKFAHIIKLVLQGKVNRVVGKKLLAKLVIEDYDINSYIAENNLIMVTDTKAIEEMISTVLADNGKSCEEYKAGNGKVIAFLVGQIMRKSGGKADPKIVNEILLKQLEAMK